MSDLTIRTDHKWKQLKYRNEVPARVLASDFDYLDEEDGFDGFILYRRRWYHTSDFMRLDAHSPFSGPWHGYHGDSFFSGVLIELSDDGESYRIGTYYS